MKMVWAVIRSSKVDAIAKRLKEIGVSGCTLYPVRGYGAEWHLYEPLVHGGHHKLEAIVEDHQMKHVAEAITRDCCTGLDGDGILCVLDLASAVNIRSKGTA
jgi:nitrogen regulatory protein P-II 1